jgi:hypothetical protein
MYLCAIRALLFVGLVMASLTRVVGAKGQRPREQLGGGDRQ